MKSENRAIVQCKHLQAFKIEKPLQQLVVSLFPFNKD